MSPRPPRKRPSAAPRSGPAPRSGAPSRPGGSSKSGGSKAGAAPKSGAPKAGAAPKSDRPKSDRPSSGRASSGPRAGVPSGPGSGPSKGSKAPRRTPAGRGANTSGARRAVPKGLGGMQVEGRQAVRELLLAGRRRVTEILIADDVDRADVLDDIAELANDLKVTVRPMSRKRIDAASHTEASQGVIAHAAELPEADLDDLCRSTDGVPFLLALDGVTDPGNLGALIRTAECAGVTGVVLPRHRAVHVTPTVTKAAAGAVEHVPMALVGGLPAAISRMSDLGIWVVGLDAGGDRSIHDLDIAPDAPVCLVLGAEGAGLSRLVRERCDTMASIPMRGQLGSLNVSVAGAIACFEIVRRRG